MIDPSRLLRIIFQWVRSKKRKGKGGRNEHFNGCHKLRNMTWQNRSAAANNLQPNNNFSFELLNIVFIKLFQKFK
ncbi:hypothetical protein Pfo_015016 [Paulownia fortunei]|nr:hypothetical protein Pfo_015016 [Paulownia fortunei]